MNGIHRFDYVGGVIHGRLDEIERMRKCLQEARRYDSIIIDNRRWIRVDQVEYFLSIGMRKNRDDK